MDFHRTNPATGLSYVMVLALISVVILLVTSWQNDMMSES